MTLFYETDSIPRSILGYFPHLDSQIGEHKFENMSFVHLRDYFR